MGAKAVLLRYLTPPYDEGAQKSSGQNIYYYIDDLVYWNFVLWVLPVTGDHLYGKVLVKIDFIKKATENTCHTHSKKVYLKVTCLYKVT